MKNLSLPPDAIVIFLVLLLEYFSNDVNSRPDSAQSLYLSQTYLSSSFLLETITITMKANIYLLFLLLK